MQIEFHFILVACRDESVRLYELIFPVDVDIAQLNTLIAYIDFSFLDLPCSVVYEKLGGVDINAGGYAVGCGLFHQCRQADFSGELLFPVVVPGNVGVQSVVGSVTVKDKGDVAVLVVKLCCCSHCAQVADAVDVDGKACALDYLIALHDIACGYAEVGFFLCFINGAVDINRMNHPYRKTEKLSQFVVFGSCKGEVEHVFPLRGFRFC